MNYENVLLISENLIKSITNISDNIAGDFLLPAIQLAQDIELEETLGTSLKDKLQELVYNNEINLDDNKYYKILLDKYIQPFLAYAAISHLVTNVRYKIANAGILTTEDEKMYNISSNETDKVKSHYKHIADTYKSRLQRFLIFNYSFFPELMRWKSLSNLRANLYSAAGCSISLGGARGKFLPNSEYFSYGYNFPDRDISI